MRKTLLFCACLVFAWPTFGHGGGTNFSITIQPQGQTVPIGGDVTFSVEVSGTGPFSFQWQFNGTNILPPTGTIMTVAGNGATAFSGDGGAATNASLYDPRGVTVDASGNLFIGDQAHDRVRKVGVNGVITTLAGGGGNLNFPFGVALDASGNLFVADYANSRIRKLGTNGVLVTVAGTGAAGYSGDGGAATSAKMNNPEGVAVDASGNLFIADLRNNRIRKVGTNGIITTVAGNGVAAYSGDGGAATNASLNGPVGVMLDPSGNLFITDNLNNVIREVSTNGVITTVVGNGVAAYSGDGGPATNASLNGPGGAMLDPSGNLFIADCVNNVIRQVDTNGIITTVAGNGFAGFSGDGGPATNAEFNGPWNMVMDSFGELLVSDVNNGRIRKAVLNLNPTLTIRNLTQSNAGYYTVIVSNPYQSVASSNAVLQLPPVLGIAGQPQSETVFAGSTASFSLTAGGTQPFTYQWLENQTNIPAILNPTATNTILVLTNVQLGQSGNIYSVVVTNLAGSTNSSNAVLTVLAPGSCLPPPPGLVSWWPGEQSAIDIAGTNNGTLAGGVTFAAGEVGRAFVFNGTSQYVDVPNSPSFDFAPSGQFTLEAWVQPAIRSQYQAIAVKSPANGSWDWGLYLTPANQFMAGFNGVNAVTSTTTAQSGRWYHVAMSYANGNWTLFVNGVAEAQASGLLFTQSTGDFAIARKGQSAADLLAGSVDEVSIYNRALAPAEIAVIYAAGGTGKCKEPVIAGQPQSQVGSWGGSITLSVNAVGSGILSYQWEDGNTPITGATNSSLVLGALQFTNAGNYTVVISNLYGVVTSSPAFVSVNPPGVSIALYSGITINGVAGLTYGIQYSTNLNNSNGWLGLANVTLSQTNELWFDLQPANQAVRYYRVVPGPISIP